MKRLIIPLLIAALLCICFGAPAEGDVLSFDPGTAQLNTGGTLQTVLVREGNPAAGELTYTSSDPRIATVDGNGLVTGIKKGKATITASVKTEKKTYKAQLKLTVIVPVTSVSVRTDKLQVYAPTDEKVAGLLTTPDNAEENELPVLVLPVKKKQQLTISAEPREASSRKTTITSSNPAVFSAAKNTVTGVAPGEAILTVASETNPEVTERFRVLVVQPVTRLAIAASAQSVAVGGQVTVSAVVTPENATIQKVAWSSGNESIATVSEDGTVTGIKRGGGRIIATATDGSNIRANMTLKVVQNPEQVTLNKQELTIDVGKTAAIKATIEPKNTDNKKVIWTSSDESVAKVGRDGRIKAVAVGQCTITCTCDALESISATATVHVQQPVKKLYFNDKAAYAFIGETTQLRWTTEPADATNPAITLTSAKESVFTVDDTGLVTGISSGKAYANAITTDGSKRKARIMVHVGRHATGVHMYRRHAYIDPGESATAGAVVEPKDALIKTMTWESSNDGVVTASAAKKDAHVSLRGVRKGTATVTGTTVDGGFQTSLKVTVGDYDHGVRFRGFDFDRKGNFWLNVRNDTDHKITRITAQVRMFDASPDANNDPIPINTKNKSNVVDIVWTGTLRPGESTGKNHWKMVNYKAPSVGIYSTRGTVSVVSYQIENDWVKTIRNKNRQLKDY